MWIIPLFAHLIGSTGYNTLLRHAASDRKTDPLFLAAIMSTAIAVPAVFGIFIADPDWSVYSTRTILLFILSASAVLAFHIINAKALEKTEASIFSFLYNFRIGIATLLGMIVFGEILSPLTLAGGAMVFTAGFILMKRTSARPSGIFFSVASGAMIAFLNVIEKYLILQVGFAAYMFPAAIIIAVLLWILVLGTKRPVDKTFIATKGFYALAVLRGISAYGFTLSLWLGALISVSTYISSLTCVTIAITAVIFLKETDSLNKKIAAGIIALAGVTLIFLTN